MTDRPVQGPEEVNMELREPLGTLIHEPTEFTKHLNFPDPSSYQTNFKNIVMKYL